ncbi:hypothetical protein KC366_g15582 [Hortaea werneckii]|uniref:F-box domain-containing protein n=1 Tax=Hortaea werneckii EXF-2000 TaxID=1157616 RepID=A0A1Z5T4U5_HORWE|nr:hypothetical protein KC358_g15368 [Hortaea werneckii]OTA31044.1 hypothetical protein BTJ68_09062 [Hortaea werneckii EXF-2000]KAI6803014.1 hypothetical protein KC350_g15299 [Hortaea werneckii]KAI6904480.1 hypothetical protein KC348_g15315 [Hortaea werneckii]KAI6922676.1 hypothetical protein KC341_g15224 [Hortaea werneckii]
MTEASPSPTTLLDLPVDILLLLIPYLSAGDFLSLTSTCHALHQDQFTKSPTYWSNLVRHTFRVPNQPVVQNDGRRWMKLYKRLRTQSRIYTWGNNEKACLGHSYDLPGFLRRDQGPAAAPRARAVIPRRRHTSWPAPMEGTQDLGVISDVQCGGWSTTLLTARGGLYTVGTLDGMQFNRRHRGAPYMQAAQTPPTGLRFPPGFAAQTAEREEPVTAIRQFSAGRAHVLGLADAGGIWSWQDIEQAGILVKFVHHEVRDGGSGGARGTVRKVVAGWDKSAALVEGTGIVVWDVLKREPGETEIEDAALVLESAVVPSTGFVRSASRQKKAADAGPGGERSGQASESTIEFELGEQIGEVQNFIVLEHLVLFNTDLGKVFASQIHWENDSQTLSGPVELPLPTTSTPENASPNTADQIFTTDIQGSFRSFAVFTRSGAVLTSTQDKLMTHIFNSSPSNASNPTDPDLPIHLWTAIPALQNNNVISLAFGDYHYHALHSTGAITSYGREPQACGALGLGGGQKGDPEGRLRGIRYQGVGGDGRLVRHAYMRGGGRQVWFDDASWEGKEKGKGSRREWIQYLTSGGADPEEAAERMRMALGSPGLIAQGEVSEWVEREGRRWEERFAGKGSTKGHGGDDEDDDDGLGAYFALSVAAAGWHSAAVVLVNEDLVERVRRGCEATPAGEEDERTSSTMTKNEGPATEAEEATPATSSSSSSSSLLNRATATAEDYTRWFLGLHPYSAPAPAPAPRPQNPSQPITHTIEQIHPPPSPHPSATSSSRPGYIMLGLEYAWAGDHFPRLRLSDGTEMPGTVEFDGWREEDGGAPEFGWLVAEVEGMGLG